MKRKFFLGLISLTLALCLCITACGGLTIRDNGDGSYTVTPNEGNDQGNQQGGNNQGSTEPSAPDYSMYSPLLQEVLNDPQWDELYRRYESNELYESSNHYDPGTNLLEAIPYEYLESKGEDIDGIKNGSVSVISDLYTIETETNYIYNRIEVEYNVKDGENYINQYLLKYRITEQELDELTMLYQWKYYQGPVMFQCLAAKQQPEVIAEFSITEKGYKNIIESCNNKNTYLSQAMNSDKIESANIISMKPITLWNEPAYVIKLYCFSAKDYNPVSNCTIYEVDSQIVVSACKLTVSNNTYDLYNLSALNPNLISSTPITYFRLFGNFKDFKELLH